MTDTPPERPRHWLEYLATAAALLISAISLWVAIGTMEANRRMVAAASWPLLQRDTSNIDLATRHGDVITFSLINGGVGPAKLKTLEIFWQGRAYSGSAELLERCCGYKRFTGPSDLSAVGRTPIATGSVHDIVIRAGEVDTFLTMPLGSDNVAVWRKLDRTRRELKFRACYCSVFDECWIGNLEDLDPRPVSSCPEVKRPYVE